MILFDAEGAVAAASTRLQDAGIVVNTSAKNEHVPEIERAGRQLKKRVGAIWNTLIVNLVYYSCKMINIFPKRYTMGGMSPRELFTGMKFDYLRDATIGFGEYIHVHMDDNVTNTMQERTLGAILLGPAGNLQGSYLFMSLTTWKVIKHRSWTNLLMPAENINLINGRAARDGNKMDVNVKMRIGFYLFDEVINDQDYNVEVPEQRVDSGPIIHDDVETVSKFLIWKLKVIM
jgi:hypothetical protein